MGELSGGEPLRFNQDIQVAVPAPVTEARIAIRRLDWNRIRRDVSRCQETQFSLSVWYSVCFSVAASLGATIIPIGATKDLPAWVWSFYVWGTIASLFLGVILALLNRNLVRQRRSRIEDIEADMHEIEGTFGSQNVERTAT